MKTMTLKERLRHHCNKAIKRGDGPISEMPAQIEILAADRSDYNESNGKGMAGCISKAGSVIAYFPTQSAFQSAKLFAAAPDMFDAIQAIVDAFGDQDSLLIDQAKAALAKAKGESK